MRTSLHEFLSMTISTPSANLCAGINRACAVYFGSSPAQISLWPTISRRKLFFALTRTFGAFAVKRDFLHGFIESPTTVFARMRAAAKSLWAWMRNNCKRSMIRKPSIPA